MRALKASLAPSWGRCGLEGPHCPYAETAEVLIGQQRGGATLLNGPLHVVGIHIAAQMSGTPRDRGGTSVRISTKVLSICIAAGSDFRVAIQSLAAEVISEQKVSARRTVQLSPAASELVHRCIEILGPTLNAISRLCEAAADLLAAGACDGLVRPSCSSLHRSA